jgi:hypothetical protein
LDDLEIPSGCRENSNNIKIAHYFSSVLFVCYNHLDKASPTAC